MIQCDCFCGHITGLQVLACCGLFAFKAMFTQRIFPSEKCVADLEENLLQSLVFLPQLCSLMLWIWKQISPIEWLTTTILISDLLFFRGVDFKKSVLYKLTQISATNACSNNDTFPGSQQIVTRVTCVTCHIHLIGVSASSQ